MEDHDVPVEVLDEAHVADAAVLDADHLAAGGFELLDSRFDVGDAQREPSGVRLERLAVLVGIPERERYVRRPVADRT